jgi:hypothetical protein
MPIVPSLHTINVTVNNGKFVFSSSSTKVMKNDQLQWTCDHDAAFSFESGRSPFKSKESFGSAPANTVIGPFTIKAPLRTKGNISSKTKKANRLKNKYKYSFSAYIGGSSPLLVEDPQVIIDDSGGGGKRKASKKAAKKKTAKRKPAKK